MGLLQAAAAGFFGKGVTKGALGGAVKAGLATPIAERGLGWTAGRGLRSAFGTGAARGAMFGAGLGAINGALSADSSVLGGALKGAAYGYGAGAIGRGIRVGARSGVRAGFGAAWKNARYGYRGLIGGSAQPANNLGKRIVGIPRLPGQPRGSSALSRPMSMMPTPYGGIRPMDRARNQRFAARRRAARGPSVGYSVAHGSI